MEIQAGTFERIYLSSVEQSNAVNAAADKSCNRRDVASVYADAIIADTLAHRDGREGVDFKVVNDAILKRWTVSGLTYIKTEAWKLVEAMQEPPCPS